MSASESGLADRIEQFCATVLNQPSDVPDAHGMVLRRSQNAPSIWAEDGRGHAGVMSGERCDCLRRMRIPDLGRRVRRRGDDAAPIVVEARIVDCVSVPGERRYELSASRIPYPRCLVGGGRNDKSSI